MTTRTMRAAWALGLLCAAGCGTGAKTGGDGAVEADAPDGRDAPADDGAPPRPDAAGDDAAGEPPGGDPDATPDGEGGDPDATPDGEDAEEEEAPPATCVPVVPHDPVDPLQKKFALQMLHFNHQYVAGGLEGFCPLLCDYDEEETEDLIIRESFIPVLDLYVAHPGWKVDIELPARMIEILGDRFPRELDKLRQLVARGQVSLISFHYSAQLFLAYPAYDQEISARMTKEVFEDHCLPLSPTVFNQEGQFGEGRHEFMRTRGWTIGVLPKNLFKYVRGEAVPRQPWYRLRGTDLVIGPGDVDPASGVQVAWPFFSDGETLAVANDFDPYLGDLFRYDPAKMAEYEAGLQALEDAGYKITTIEDYVRHMRGQGVPQPEIGPVLDGTWQPPSTDGIHRWLGGMGILPWSTDEKDNAVRTRNWRARTLLNAADLLIDHAEASLGPDTAWAVYRGSMETAWRHVLFAEVSDATGINPWVGELRYSLAHCGEAEAIADVIVAAIKGRLGAPYVSVDLASGAVAALSAPPPAETFPAVSAPLAVTIVADRRAAGAAWYDTSEGGAGNRWRLVVTFGPASGIFGNKRTLRVAFARTGDRIVYSPGLLEDELVDYGEGDFVFQEGKHWLPLPNGIIGLGGDWYVVKHAAAVHVAALVTAGGATIDFVDDTQPEGEGAAWVFELFRGARADALAIANRVNIRPVVVR